MPDDTGERVGERVARVETRIEGVEKDTSIIRATLHCVNGELQKIVGREERREATLKVIADQTSSLPELMIKVRLIDELRPQLQVVIDENKTRKGATRAIAILAAGAATLIAVLGTLGAGVIWLFEFLLGKHP